MCTLAHTHHGMQHRGTHALTLSQRAQAALRHWVHRLMMLRHHLIRHRPASKYRSFSQRNLHRALSDAPAVRGGEALLALDAIYANPQLAYFCGNMEWAEGKRATQAAPSLPVTLFAQRLSHAAAHTLRRKQRTFDAANSVDVDVHDDIPRCSLAAGQIR